MNQDKKKARFNLIDAIIILIILLVVGAAVYLLVTDYGDSKKAENGNVEFVVRLSAVDEHALSLITENQIVKDSVSGTTLGTIREVRTEKTRYYGDTAVPSGGGYTLTISEYEDKYDVYVTISAHANLDDKGIYSIGNTRILVGSTVYFKVPSFTQISYITAFSPKTAG